MSGNEFLTWTSSDIDFYALLGLTSESCTESEVQRAYRKTALKYHPDKLGKDFDPQKYEQFQAANEVLKDPALKAKYDAHRQAKLARQRANNLFEGKRRQMKEDLEAGERGAAGGGLKRSREEGERQAEMVKLAEKGRAARAARASKLAEAVASSPAPPPPQAQYEPPKEQSTPSKGRPQYNQGEEDEVERLERKIREAEAAKAKRKAAKRARKSGVFVPAAESPGMTESRPKMADRDTHTPIKRPDIFRGLKADDRSSASPKFSFSPSIPTPKRNDFAATMARLKAAEKQRLEDEIRKEESETA